MTPGMHSSSSLLAAATSNRADDDDDDSNNNNNYGILRRSKRSKAMPSYDSTVSLYSVPSTTTGVLSRAETQHFIPGEHDRRHYSTRDAIQRREEFMKRHVPLINMCIILFVAVGFFLVATFQIHHHPRHNENLTKQHHHDPTVSSNNSTDKNNDIIDTDDTAAALFDETTDDTDTDTDEIQIHGLSLLNQMQAQINATHHPEEQETTTPCQATVLLLRHCETMAPRSTNKEESSDDSTANHEEQHCSHLGYQRARYIATLFDNKKNNSTVATQQDSSSRWPLPTKLYALSIRHDVNNKKSNFHHVETLMPLARNIVATIAQYSRRETSLLVKDVFSQLTTHCQQTTTTNDPPLVLVIVWKQSYMTQLARSLGWTDKYAPSQYPRQSFDQVWQLNYILDRNEMHEEFAHHDKYKMMNTTDKQQGENNTAIKKRTTEWFVYGTVTQEYFDPLEFQYHQRNTPP